MESQDTCLVSRRGFSCFVLGSVSTLVCLVLAHVSSFHVSSCLISHDWVLTVSLSGIAKCLFCSETLAFLAEGPFTICRTVVLVAVVVLPL